MDQNEREIHDTVESPKSVVERKIAAHEREIARIRVIESRVVGARLALFAAFAVSLWLAFVSTLFSGWWTLPPFVAFVALIVFHDRLIRRRERAERARGYWSGVAARMRREWNFECDDGTRFTNPHHTYADDLEIFGEYSLFALLSDRESVAGASTLAKWLLEPASPHAVRNRQSAIAELTPRLDLRESFAVVERPRPGKSAFEQEMQSVAAMPETISLGAALLMAFLGALNFATVWGWFGMDWGPTPFVGALLISGVAHLRYASRANRLLADVERMAESLDSVSTLLARIEGERFDAPSLREIQEGLTTGGEPASRAIHRLDRIVALLDSARNQIFMPIAALLHWRALCATAVGRWRRRHGDSAAQWIRNLGEFEALLALSSYAWSNPSYVFPELADDTGRFEALALGHPLLPPPKVVCNDLSLGVDCRVLIVSGSNMSGKSTLLRTIGVNVVLAQAGAPVFARRFLASALRVGASIVVRDSLQEGRSRFYAEISRIKSLVELAGEEPPLLFLIDEVLHGTNSHDRRIGASAIVRGLVERGAIGLVTTHDLAIAEVIGELGGRGRNVHFEDTIVDGVMHFDYRLQDGVVRKSNAIELMRSVGIEV